MSIELTLMLTLRDAVPLNFRSIAIESLGPVHKSSYQGNGVASYKCGTGAGAPSTSNCLIFLVTSEPHNLDTGLYKYYYIFVAVYCVNFVIFWRVTLKLSSFSFAPLLARNPGDANVSMSFLTSYKVVQQTLLQ